MRLPVFVSAALLSVAFALSLHAQVASEIRGRVADRTGAAVSNAQVTLTEMRTGVHFRAVSGSDGYFDFASLVPGRYRVEASAPGFNTLQREGVTLNVGQTVSVDLPLPVATGSEVVTVNADLPVLQSQTSDIQATIPQVHIEAIPLNSRNFIQLTQLAPGVELPPGTLLPRINGGRPRTNEYLYDGISALQPEPGQVAFFPILDRHRRVHRRGQQRLRRVRPLQRRRGQRQHALRHQPAGTARLFEYLRNEDLNAATTSRPPQLRDKLASPSTAATSTAGRLGFRCCKDKSLLLR